MNQALKDQSKVVFDHFEQQMNEALQSGDPRQVDNIIQATAYVLGASIPKVVLPEGIGPMTERVLEYFVSGIRTSIKIERIPGRFEVVIGKRL